MKLSYVTFYDVSNPNSFNGRGYFKHQGFKNEFVVNTLGPISPSDEDLLLFEERKIFYNNSVKKRFDYNRSTSYIKYCGEQIHKRLSNTDTDIVFSPVSPGSQPVAYLECKQPIVIWTDATFAGVLDFYPSCSRSVLCQETIRDALINEKAALSRCSLAIYASEWAAKTAIDNYSIDTSKVKVVPLGANIDRAPNFNEINAIINSRNRQVCKLLFLGMEWYRKGGDIAVEVAKKLNSLGLKTELTVVGCSIPIDEPLPKCVKSLDYVSKLTKEGLSKFNQLLTESHFLIVPSRAEGFGHVFCEASAFGVPCITTNVGGIPGAVRDNLNGKAFSPNVTIDEYCHYIDNLFTNYKEYEKLALASFNEFNLRLNWQVNIKKVKKLMLDLLENKNNN